MARISAFTLLLAVAVLLLAVMAALPVAHAAASLSDDHLLAEYDARLQQHSPRRTQVGPPRESHASRMDALRHSRHLLAEHNARHANQSQSYFLAWTPLADLTTDEFRSFLRSRPRPDDHDAHQRRILAAQPTLARVHAKQQQDGIDGGGGSAEAEAEAQEPLPKNWNWLEIEGGKYVTPIKNQGTCGSCWAFAAVSVIESRAAIEQERAASPLSVEQVLSCSAPLDHLDSKFADMSASSNGCNGGMPFIGYEYMSRAEPHGIACARDYPYVMATRVNETSCRDVDTNSVAVSWQEDASDYIAVTPDSEEALQRAVMSGPVSANIDGEADSMRLYGGGIYDAQDCQDGDAINHAVVVVGFGETDDGDKYWLIRNTWGTMWGENGYMRLARGTTLPEGTHGPCNLYTFSSYPVNLAVSDDGGRAVCAATDDEAMLASRLQALSWTALLSFDGLHWFMVLSIVLGCVIGGVAVFFVTEQRLKQTANSREGGPTYKESYDRWMLPSKEQIAAVVARRRQRRGDHV